MLQVQLGLAGRAGWDGPHRTRPARREPWRWSQTRGGQAGLGRRGHRAPSNQRQCTISRCCHCRNSANRRHSTSGNDVIMATAGTYDVARARRRRTGGPHLAPIAERGHWSPQTPPTSRGASCCPTSQRSKPTGDTEVALCTRARPAAIDVAADGGRTRPAWHQRCGHARRGGETGTDAAVAAVPHAGGCHDRRARAHSRRHTPAREAGDGSDLPSPLWKRRTAVVVAEGGLCQPRLRVSATRTCEGCRRCWGVAAVWALGGVAVCWPAPSARV